jgi:hypothetical protein
MRHGTPDEPCGRRWLDVAPSLRLPRIEKLPARTLSALVILVLTALPANALTGAEIMLRAAQVRTQGDGASTTLSVELRSKSGARVTRTVATYRKVCDGASKQLLVMRSPADVAGAAFLSWMHPHRYPDMWMYLPELGRPRQLNPATTGESFMGSDFTYEDLGGPVPDDRTHEIVDQPFVYGEPTYQVESVPRAHDLYSRIVTWVSQRTFLPVRVEYYGHDGDLLKVGRFADVRTVKGVPTPFTLGMENVRTGHRTTVTLLEADFDRPFDCALFTVRGLSRARR